MEVDWVKRYLEHYLSDGNKIVQQLMSREVSNSFLDHSLRLLVRFLEMPRQVSSQEVDEVMVQVAQALYPHIQPRGYWNYIASWWPKVKIIAEQLPDLTTKAEIIKELAIVKNIQGEVKEAQNLYEQLIASPDFELIPPVKQVDILHQVGVCHLRQGGYIKAKDPLTRCSAISDAYNLWEFKGYALNQLGNIALVYGNFDEAHHCYEESLNTFKLIEGESSNLVCIAYQSLGRLFVLQGRFTEAIPSLEKAMAIRRYRQEEEGAAHCAIFLAAAYLECNRLSEAESLLAEALKVCKKLRERRGEILCYLYFGHLETRQGRNDAAITQWQQALEILKNFPVPMYEPLILVALLLQLIRTGQVQESLSTLRRLFNNLRKQNLRMLIKLFLTQMKKLQQGFLTSSGK